MVDIKCPNCGAIIDPAQHDDLGRYYYIDIMEDGGINLDCQSCLTPLFIHVNIMSGPVQVLKDE